uniref:Uncharacterized protein n=1 Tax=Chenopodium quinoa TaxID=63459 RepID=A0A803LT75_CHEQI
MLMAQDLLRDTLEKYINPDKMPVSIVTTYVMPDETTILRDTGKRYFEELLSRGIFEKPVSVFGNGNSRSVYSCEMNPLVCDAARRLAAEEVAVFSTRNSDGSSSVTVGQRTKHVAFHKNGFSRFNLEKVIQNCENTTSLLMFSSHWDAFFGGSAGQIVRLDNLRQLRVLDLSGCQFRKLPPIRLSSLKYLSLLGNVLLESFSCEFFPLLETLDIHGCVRLENVVGLELLSDLRNLYLTSRQSSLTLGFHRRGVLLEVSHCVHLIDIRGLHMNILRIFDCPSLKTLHIRYLEELVLHNCASLVIDYGTQLYGRSIYLKRLELVGLPMVRLPDWLQFAQVLEYFMIKNCPQLQKLESVKYLRSLQELYIYSCPNLRSLPYNALYSLPNLNLLDIRNCPKLTGIPTWLSNIQEVFSAIPSFFRKSSSTGRAKTHKPQSSSESKGLLINHNHWRTLALVFKAIMRMKTIVSPGRDLTKLHCCLFPDDYEFERETLVQLWMAVGFLGDIHMEDAGNLRFDALLEGQYILPARIDILTGKSKYKVNYDKVTNLLNGIQTLQNKDLRAMLEDEDASVVGWHVSIVSNDIDQATFETLKTFNELRTLLFVRNYGSSLKQIPSDLFLALKSIQALDLSGSHITELPSSIGNLIQLSYLDLSFTLIESLPESIDQLHQLQTLKLEGCRHLYILPDGMKELIGLRCLDFDVLGQLTCMPKGMGALTELRILSAFIVDSGEGCSIRELQHMNNLKGSFCISGLENVTQREAKEATLFDKRYLIRLQLRWNDFKSYDDQKRHDIFWTTYHLEPNSCLEELEILYYPGLILPPWVGFPKFQGLCSITLLKCSIVELHIKLGKLPNLRYLNISFMSRLTVINYRVHRLFIDEHCCGFPKLETLQIDGMPKLATWDGVRYGDFPLLSKLYVKQCPKLSVLPFLPDLPSLKHLEISHCKVLNSLSTGPTLSTSLESLVIDACPLLKKRYIRGGEGWFEIEHIPDITIDLKDVRSTHEDGVDDDASSAGSNSDSDYYEGSDNNVHPYDSC